MSKVKTYFVLECDADIEIYSFSEEERFFDGVEEFSFTEEQIDETLGKDAFVGAEVNLDLVKKLSDHQKNKKHKFYFYSTNAFKRLQRFVEVLSRKGIVSVDIQELEEEDWNEKWRESYSAIELCDAYRIVPSWEKTESSDHSKNIYIYPGMGFGTGTHPTTYLCLKLFLEELSLQENEKILDLGCGSGILGIACLRENRTYAIDFCDVDKGALDNTVQNLELNFEGDNLDKVSVVLRDRYKGRKNKLVFANILQNILFLEADFILSNLEKDSFLILSGLTVDQAEETSKHFESFGLKHLKTSIKNDWSAILLKKI